MLDNALIRRKLGFLLKHLKELEPLTTLSLEEYKADLLKRHAAERIVELIVEYATDLNQIVLEGLDQPPAQTYYDTFRELGRLGILPLSLMPRLASATGLRNRLVHRYESINDETVYYSLQPLLRNYREYAGLIEGYLQSQESRPRKRSKKKR